MRLTVRAILCNRKTNKMLFIKYVDLLSESTQMFKDGFWVMPGGGVQTGETGREALKREIFEETGIVDLEVKNAVLSRVGHANLHSVEENIFYERYYLVETEAEEIITDHLTDFETCFVKEYKWWSKEELAVAKAVVFPDGLMKHLDKALENPPYPTDMTDVDALRVYGLEMEKQEP